MREILLIRGGPAERAVDALAVAAEASAALGSDTQIDIATPAEFAEVARLSTAVRRVIAVASPETGDWGEMTPDAGGGGSGGSSSGGLGGKLFSAAKKVSSLAGKNVRAYWQLAEEVRITQYDEVFDFEFSAFSVAVAKLAKTQKVIGFDPQTVPAALPGAALMAHHTYIIKGEMSPSARMRKLVAKYYDYYSDVANTQLDWRLRPGEAPPQHAPYLLVSANLPLPFVEAVQQGDLPLLTLDETLPPLAWVGGVQGAALVVGSGIATALAPACGVEALYVGRAEDAPQSAQVVTTPAELAQALAVAQQRRVASAAPLAPATPPAPAVSAVPKTIKLKRD